MTEDINQLTEYYFERKKNGADFTEIRKDMEMKNYNQEVISQVIRKVDDKLLGEHTTKQIATGNTKFLYAGVIIMLTGGVLTLVNFLHWINLTGKLFIIYILIVGGYAMVIISRKFLKNKK